MVDERELGSDPIAALRAWLAEAQRAADRPQVMTLATATPDGLPSARIVLLRGVDEGGLVFFTNRESRKGEELQANPRAAVVLHWWDPGRQVRVEGTVEEIARSDSAAYWETRPRASRIAGWVSAQSRPLADREQLDAAYADAEARFGRRPPPGPLGRVPPPAGLRRVLAPSREPPARPGPLHARAPGAGVDRLAP